MRWHLLIHQLPPKPAYLRAKIGQRLARVGAVALKNSVYVLPERPESLEDLQWIAEEAVAGGGEAFVLTAELAAGISDAAVEEVFRAARDRDYEALAEEVRAARPRRGAPPPPARLAAWRRRFAEIRELDFFAAPARGDVELLLANLEALEAPAAPRAGGKAVNTLDRKELIGKTWVTRSGVFVDRIATAWLVRRFVDPQARFRFVGAQGAAPRRNQLRFDMVGGELGHDGPRCTFETALLRLGLDDPIDPGLVAIGEIVHDIDLKEDAFGRPETDGVRAVLRGIADSCPDDTARLERGFAVFDGLYASLRHTASARPRRKPRQRKLPVRSARS
ncbi:MAG: chromate resistance protein ChrB domain-containing protein [Acidobacteriota bacterium]